MPHGPAPYCSTARMRRSASGAAVLTRSGPGHAGRAAALDDRERHLPRGLVDHLALEHHGARPVDLGRGAVGVEDPLGPVELVLRRRVDLVADRDLVGVDRPLAVEAEPARAPRRAREAVEVADRRVRPVDRLEPERARRRDDPREHVVPLVAGIRRVDRADRELRHPRARRRSRPGRRSASRSAARRPRSARPRRGRAATRSAPRSRSAARLRACARAGRAPAATKCTCGGALDLRHDHAVEALAGAADDREQVVEAPRRADGVDADDARRRAPRPARAAPRRRAARVASFLQLGATASSRSRNTSSAGSVRPPSRASSRSSPGTARQERRCAPVVSGAEPIAADDTGIGSRRCRSRRQPAATGAQLARATNSVGRTISRGVVAVRRPGSSSASRSSAAATPIAGMSRRTTAIGGRWTSAIATSSQPTNEIVAADLDARVAGA